MDEDLNSLRTLIDSLDAEILDLLNRRADLARQIGQSKSKDNAPFFTPEREQAIYRRLREINAGPLEHAQVAAIFREVISAARALEKQLVVSFLGPKNTFSHMAALYRFGSSAEFLPTENIADAFVEVERGNADYGVVPVENSIAGVVPETLDTFPQSNVKILAEVYVSIAHHLVCSGESLDSIRRVYSHPQPVQQCRRWLRSHLPQAEIVEAPSTAKAAEMALNDPGSAGITNSLAAAAVGIPVLVEHIEENPHNRTRFLVIGYNEPMPTGKDKTSLMFTLKNRPGELYRALGALEKAGVNMTMIESRPAQRRDFEYVFYADIQGHRVDRIVEDALKNLREFVVDLTCLGSYPEAE
jgi:chorismate mutase/prephenate dehydratase